MSGFITQNQNTLTWTQAMADVAGVLGNAGDPPQEAIAKSCIQDVLRDMNSAREWTFLCQTTTGNVTTDGLITLPSRTKKIYALTVDSRVMEYMNQRDWLKQVDLTQSLGGTAAYLDYNTAVTNTIEVRDHPNGTVAYVLYWLGLLTVTPSTNGDVVDVPESIMAYILAQAKADYVARIDSSSPKLQFFIAQATQRWRRIVRDDEASKPDQDLRMVPGYLFPSEMTWDVNV